MLQIYVCGVRIWFYRVILHSPLLSENGRYTIILYNTPDMSVHPLAEESLSFANPDIVNLSVINSLKTSGSYLWAGIFIHYCLYPLHFNQQFYTSYPFIRCIMETAFNQIDQINPSRASDSFMYFPRRFTSLLA